MHQCFEVMGNQGSCQVRQPLRALSRLLGGDLSSINEEYLHAARDRKMFQVRQGRVRDAFAPDSH